MTRTRLIIAGALCAVIAIAVALVAIPRLQQRTITVTAHFADAVGLYAGNPVSELGMQIGTVTKVESKGSYVAVTMELDKSVAIPADVIAVTVSASLLTDRHVELTPPYTGGPTLDNGDLIALGNTRTPVEFDQTLTMIDKLGTALRGDANGGGPLGDLVNLGSQITRTSGADIKATLDKLSQALKVGSDGGAGTQKNLQDIIRSVSELTQSAADHDNQIRQFGSNIRQLSDLLADQNLGTGRTGAKANEILEQTADLLNRHRDQLKGTFTNADTITRSLVDSQRELAEILDVAPTLIDNVNNVVDPEADTVRIHVLVDKILFNGQMAKEICNLMGLKQLSCATGTLKDYGPDFGLTSVLDLMANGIREPR